ncbi:hypothetical protein IRT45_14100 [Nocardia sp. BSTN01]|uniref:hypothetical protein n=1 Tax=Nocardia sp. BSTN01 TaxID=2783665 RepID=UPI00188EB4D2|nr:hypothetical protein [Nocardia sp. BSTN01]MBF4998285.1 hypothetical protein [Nocardia sp. BSTN01]
MDSAADDRDATAIALAGMAPEDFLALGRDAYRDGRTDPAAPIDPDLATALARSNTDPDHVLHLINEYLRGWQEAASQSAAESGSATPDLEEADISAQQITATPLEVAVTTPDSPRPLPHLFGTQRRAVTCPRR